MPGFSVNKTPHPTLSGVTHGRLTFYTLVSSSGREGGGAYFMGFLLQLNRIIQVKYVAHARYSRI